ncbi:MAG: Fe-S cluster assembly sulfur transfer protein SufU [Gammaproteobacteria bacterium]|jgi:nitrogen fixation NifU-like protein
MSFDMKDLYQDVIVDHNRSPRNFGKMEDADRLLEGYNPLCGDRLTLYIKFDGDKIGNIQFDGSGCAISVASASLMTDVLKGKTKIEADKIFSDFHMLLTDEEPQIDIEKFGKLAALVGVREYPSRIKCASLCWHTLHGLLEETHDAVSTE